MGSSFYEFAERVCVDIGKTIQSELSRRFFIERLGFAMFMPLTINIKTEEGSGSLLILNDGTVKFEKRCSSVPDITLQSSLQTLASLYDTRSPAEFFQAEKQGKIKMVNHNFKGQQAERKVRELLGGLSKAT